MSITVVRPGGLAELANDGSDQVPDLITLPGAYMSRRFEPSIGLTGPLLNTSHVPVVFDG